MNSQKYKKKVIALFIPGLNGGGAQRFIINLANSLTDLTDNLIHIVLTRKDGILQKHLKPEVNIIDLGTKKVSRSIPAIVNYLKITQPMAIISTLNYANVVCLVSWIIAGKPCKIIVREANIIRKVKGESFDRIQSIIVLFLMKVLYPYADKVIAICNDVLKTMLDAGIKIEENAVLIGNPIFIPEITSDPLAIPWLPKRTTPFICAAGRLTEQKGFDVLINAFAKINDKQIHLVILGEGPLRFDLKSQTYKLGIQERVHLPGFVNNPTEIIRQSRLFVLSSRWEGFVNVLLEALACGTPVVSTNCPGAPKEILKSGSYGHLVPCDDVDALARGIEFSLDKPISTPEQRISRAYDFSSDKIAKLYLKHIL
ncbi:glycosyltransferase [Desulfosarcina widdelii]|nr:glycosyltransferase [Desulfosarcina widdelii]